VIFDSEARLARRSVSRQSLKLDDSDFVALLIGNDWKKKGLDQLLRALAIIEIPIRLLVVGKDDPGLYRSPSGSYGQTTASVSWRPLPTCFHFMPPPTPMLPLTRRRLRLAHIGSYGLWIARNR